MEMPLRIREATNDDVAEMGRIYIDGWNDSVEGLLPSAVIGLRTLDYRIQYLSTRLATAPQWRPLVGEVNGAIVVIACPKRHADTTCGEVEHIYVDRAFRRFEFATAMTAHILRMFGLAKIPNAVLWSFEGNEQAALFYRSTGWRLSGRHKQESIDETDAVLTVVEYTREIT